MAFDELPPPVGVPVHLPPPLDRPVAPTPPPSALHAAPVAPPVASGTHRPPTPSAPGFPPLPSAPGAPGSWGTPEYQADHSQHMAPPSDPAPKEWWIDRRSVLTGLTMIALGLLVVISTKAYKHPFDTDRVSLPTYCWFFFGTLYVLKGVNRR